MQLETIKVPMRPLPAYRPPRAPLEYLLVDEHMLAVVKPSGLLAVPGVQPGAHDCLESRVKADYPDARIVHRLDWDTSGILLFGRTAKTHAHLGYQFEKRSVEKEYVARVWGHPMSERGFISLPLRCDWPNRPKQMVDYEQGRSAMTYWSVTSRTETTSDLLLKPETGRSHQLRVHCQQLGTPILGDRMYAPDAAYYAHRRMCLHAQKLSFYHPVTRERLSLESPSPF